ncbi:MAG: hypothetical protein NPIRA01_17540 [Nitrospirales bacterium]|nr:MAG: hypothetical protein NPIRA01_17540 [Nitrospirales bacterium]
MGYGQGQQQGFQANTPVWVIRDGVMVDLVAESKQKKRSRVNIIKGGMSRERLAKRTPKR